MSDHPSGSLSEEPKSSDGNEITDRLMAEHLQEEWQRLVPTNMLNIAVGAKTDLGSVRENNEDKFDWLEPYDPHVLAAKGRLYGVADGMGGHSAGQIASELALKTVIRAYYADSATDVAPSLNYAIDQANRLIFETAQIIPDRRDMGTTLTIGVVHETRMIVAHAGDSRAYLIREDTIEQITHDHSWVAEQVTMGALTQEQAQLSPFRNIITRSIGTQPTVEPDFFSVDLQIDDRILFCSDGLTGHLDSEEILTMVNSTEARRAGPSVTAMRLIDEANHRGGRDNITVVLLHVQSCAPYAFEEVVAPNHRLELDDAEPVPDEPLERPEPEPRANSRGWSFFGAAR